MNEPGTVLDSSAFLAYLQAEDGAKIVQEALAQGCLMSSVNWAEVLSKVAELGQPSHVFLSELSRRRLLGAALQVLPFAAEDAPLVGDLRPKTRNQGLSLGDRACLGLGHRLHSPILTADRAWAKLDLDFEVEIRMIR